MAKRKVNKAAFIMGFPVSTSPKEVSAEGKAKGITFSTNYVSRIRSLNSKTKRRGPGRPPGSKNKAKAASHGSSSESAFRKLVLDLGTARAKALLADVERALAKLISG